jgi:hypothetical protein
VHSVRQKEEKVTRLRDQLQAGATHLSHPQTDVIQVLQTQVLTEHDRCEEVLLETAQLTQLLARTAAALVRTIQAVCKKQTLDLQVQCKGVSNLRTAVLRASKKAGFVAQAGRFQVGDVTRIARTQRTKRNARIDRLHLSELSINRSVETLTHDVVSRSAVLLQTSQRTANTIAGVERSAVRSQLATLQRVEALSQVQRLRAQVANLTK